MHPARAAIIARRSNGRMRMVMAPCVLTAAPVGDYTPLGRALRVRVGDRDPAVMNGCALRLQVVEPLSKARTLILATCCGAALAACEGRERPPLHPASSAPRIELASAPGARTSAPAETGVLRSFELVAAPTTLPLLDGRALEVWAYDGQVPGPTLRADVGDRIRVRLTNRLPQPTSVHWHGIRLENAMDGVPGVTQPPIEPGGSFTYEFVARDPGTFWFHPHVRGSEQVERGLHGVLVVDDPREARARELVWVVDDWRLDASGAIDPAFVTRHDLAHDGRWGRVISINGRIGHHEPIAPGERVRVRIVNVANGRVFAPRVVGAEARIIAFDGRPTSGPLPLDALELRAGQPRRIWRSSRRPIAPPTCVWSTRSAARRPSRGSRSRATR